MDVSNAAVSAEIINIAASGTYDIVIGQGLLPATGSLLAQRHKVCKVMVITDDKVAPLYAATVEESLQQAGFDVCRYTFPHGEQSKNMATLIDILEALASRQFTRTDLLVALGGGVTGDMAGFAAATYLRGIGFVQIPTTFLAAIDSSVGGKTAVNLAAGKNLAGAFHQPVLVICDYDTLRTLPPEELASGGAEAVKYGVLMDEELFRMLNTPNWTAQMHQIICRCIAIKRDLVMTDEFDTGARQLLNLGHTLAHAIEKESDYTISHGQAVAMGMVVIAKAAHRYGLTDTDCSEEICRALRHHHLETVCPYPIKKLCRTVLSDKKRTGGTITLVIPKSIGDCMLHKLPVEELENFFSLGMKD